MESNTETVTPTPNTTTIDISALNERIKQESAFVDLLNLELSKTIVGQKYMVERLMLALLSGGHILLEGVRDWQKL